jgi:uncharacterized repeat protein (TIGR03847 family)
MPRRIFSFDEPERFVAGTVGQPGARAFFLQARDGHRIVSVGLEKAQVAVLAERMAALLDELGRHGLDLSEGEATEGAARTEGSARTGRTDDTVATAPGSDAARSDVAPLDEPLQEAFRAGTLTLTWDGDRQRIIVEAREITEADEAGEPVEVDDDDEDGPDLIRVVMQPRAARDFAARAAAVVNAGRPPCPFCGQPLDPTGHLCPRRNGAGYLN